jgi:ATP-dependent exoDNAse (exonuclease V) beta subunit
MAELTIYKASAGSGKTFRLVLEYLKLLVINPYNYRHILAVTFTNKATAEMKERILRDLFGVCQKTNRDLIEMLVDETNLDFNIVIENAGIAMSNILHDYDRFAVSTIDSFFQRVLRSFARESGLYGAYEVELDSDSVLQEACDRLLLSVEDDVELRNWLMAMSEDMLTEGKTWQVRDKILELGYELFNDECRLFIQSQGSLETERDKLKSLKADLYKTRNRYENECRKLGNKALELLEQNNATLDDFSYKKASFANLFFKLSNYKGGVIEPGKRFLAAIDNVESWTGKGGNTALMQTLEVAGLNDLMREIEKFLNEYTPGYITALEISKFIYAMGLLSTLSVKLRETGQEANTLLLNESNTLLNGIIGTNDAPFVYEKTGSYYNYFMIDEFQDTSLTQWENFRPLVVNSLSENNPCLVVGDVKQSIYRWRNGDWQLLDHELKNQLARFGVKDVELDSNWRSSENVVNFNNRFFTISCNIVQSLFNKEAEICKPVFEKHKNTIIKAFADVGQKPASGKKGGYIQCNFIESDDNSEYHQSTLQQLIETIEELQRKGVRAKDIAVLVYKNAHGKEVAEALLNHKKIQTKYNFEVISDDSLFIESSPAVRMLVGLMRYILSPSDKVLQASVLYLYSRKLLPGLKLQGKVPPRFVSTTNQQELFFENTIETLFFSEQVKADYFPFFEDKEYRNRIHKWGTRSIGDLTEELIRDYYLDYLPGEQATLQAFKDVVSDFSKKDGGNLHKFIEWWDRFGTKVKIQSAGERDAIRIMTVHKSKGLEFPYVLVPFCDENFEPNSNGRILWCSTKNTSYGQFPLVPVKYSKILANSSFVNEYFTEKIMSYIDSLNVLYVAFTRAEKALFIFTKAQDKLKASSESLLNEVIREGTGPDFLLLKQSDNVYSIGDLEITGSVDFTSDETKLFAFQNRKPLLTDALRLRSNYDGFLDDAPGNVMQKVNEGKIMHELLSEIETIADIDHAIGKLLNAGKIDSTRVRTFRSDIEGLLMNPKSKEWFSGKLKVLNETTILSLKYGLLRPDRVMIDGAQKAIVVDYKATSIVSNNHKKQVQKYASLLKQMGFKIVEAYVWYLNNNYIKPIEDE